MEKQSDECLICGAPLEYLEQAEPMTCSICRQTVPSNVRCRDGHYVCDACHTSGVDQIVSICMSEQSTNPIALLERMMSLPFCHMHGPEHHIMVSAALITAYHNAGGEVTLPQALSEAIARGKQVPGGVCGNWGACGAGISTGIFWSIVTKSSPLAKESWALGNRMTSYALGKIAEHGGPRCCKRDSYLAILAAIDFIREHLGIALERPEEILCTRSAMNNQCIGTDCPFKKKTL